MNGNATEVMRTQLSRKIEAGRVRDGYLGSSHGVMYGMFLVPGPCGRVLKIMAGEGDPLIPWEHVSVSVQGKHPPNWQEMCWVKDQWWGEEETVVQFHPKASKYVNTHPNCLHLWKRVGPEHELPPLIAV